MVYSGTSDKGHTLLRTQCKKKNPLSFVLNYTFKPLKSGNLPLRLHCISFGGRGRVECEETYMHAPNWVQLLLLIGCLTSQEICHQMHSSSSRRV